MGALFIAHKKARVVGAQTPQRAFFYQSKATMHQLTNINQAILTTSSFEVSSKQSNEYGATMTSLEILEVINELREPDSKELRHDNFMVKLEKHPGIDSPKFLGQYKDSTGRTLKCYYLPKREAELMVMSESLAVQAKVYDRLAELEAKQVAPVMTLPQDYIQALESLLASKKSEQLAIEQRDHAVATKAQIGNKREAMATASAKSREASRLKARMGEATHSASIVAVENATKRKFGAQDWRKLKACCTAAGLSMGRSFNPGLQLEVNTYPAAAWLEVFGVDLVELFGEVTA